MVSNRYGSGSIVELHTICISRLTGVWAVRIRPQPIRNHAGCPNGQKESIMDNVNFEVKGNVLTITVDLAAKGTVSASGKSTVIGSTRGNVAIGKGGCKMGLNVYKPVKGSK